MTMAGTVLATWKMFILCELSRDRMAASEDTGFLMMGLLISLFILLESLLRKRLEMTEKIQELKL